MASFKNGFATFMDTEKESKRWHKGIYQGMKDGLRRHNPARVSDDMRIFKKNYKEWYADDDHYYDVPYFVCYTVTSSAEIAIAGGLIHLFGGDAAAFIQGYF